MSCWVFIFIFYVHLIVSHLLNTEFCFAFQSSFGHYFLIVRTIIFIIYIIYLFENLWLHFDCRRCRDIFI